MTIGAITVADDAGAKASAPLYATRLTFAGDAAYAAGGTAGFLALFQAAVKQARKIVAIIPGNCGGYLVTYDQAADKLKVWDFNTDSADGPAQETATSNLSGTTFEIIVLSQ